MKIIELKGGLGNQLFIYSAYRNVVALGYDILIDDTSGFIRDIKYKRNNKLSELELDYDTANVSYQYRWVRNISRVPLLRRIINVSHSEDSLLNYEKSIFAAYHVGYYQSLKLALSARSHIESSIEGMREKVKLKYPYVDFERDAIVHVRFFDRSIDMSNNVPVEYYRKALNAVKSDDNTRFYFVSDGEFDFDGMQLDCDLDQLSRLKGDSDLEDFLLLSLFKKIVTSNSTFSWWAAFLFSDGKHVAAPGYYKCGEGAWGDLSIFPSDWKVIK